MYLTDHTDYSLRVLMYLNQRRNLVTLNELAVSLKISKNNLIKVSHQLAKIGLIETSRGRSGGIWIHPGAGEKSLREIVLQTEESFRPAECFSGRKCECTFLPACGLKKTLAGALTAFLDALAMTTLNDVTPRTSGASLQPRARGNPSEARRRRTPN